MTPWYIIYLQGLKTFLKPELKMLKNEYLANQVIPSTGHQVDFFFVNMSFSLLSLIAHDKLTQCEIRTYLSLRPLLLLRVARVMDE